MDLLTIQKQLKDAHLDDTFGTRREIKALPDIINDGEIIKSVASGFVESGTVLMLCTNQRVLFVNKGLIYGISSSEIPLDKINGVSYSKGLILAKMSIVNGAKTTIIDKISKDDAERMAKTIKDEAKNYKERLIHQNSENVSSPKKDPADEIRKFKGLADDGIITQAEFEAKKKQLLNL